MSHAGSTIDTVLLYASMLSRAIIKLTINIYMQYAQYGQSMLNNDIRAIVALPGYQPSQLLRGNMVGAMI